ncbi:MAG: hypothetical protein JRE70_05725 [Deltaproteobacteria bacterium]|nr:hypothetical protein [Deltaproteobacteria bacterium]
MLFRLFVSTPRLLGVSIALVVLLGIAPHAHSLNLIAFDVVGTIVGAGDNSGGLATVPPVGTILTGTFTFDADTLDASPTDPFIGQYDDAIVCATFDWQGPTVLGIPTVGSTLASGYIDIVDDSPDSYEAVLASDFLAFDGGFWIELAAFSLTLNDYDDAAFGGVTLPVTPPDLAPFEDAALAIVLWIDTQAGKNVLIGAEIDSFTLGVVAPCPVPEPEVALMLPIGMAMLAGLARLRLALRPCGRTFQPRLRQVGYQEMSQMGEAGRQSFFES